MLYNINDSVSLTVSRQRAVTLVRFITKCMSHPGLPRSAETCAGLGDTHATVTTHGGARLLPAPQPTPNPTHDRWKVVCPGNRSTG